MVPVDSVLATIVNDLAQRTRPLFLILDDCHFLTAPEIGRFLEALLAYAPGALHLVAATRGPMPFQLANIRVKGQLINLDETHLRFSLEEAESFLNETRVLDLPMADVVTLQHRTEGWAAGLQLASLSLEQREERADFIRHFSGSHRDIAEFLAQDVLARQSKEMLDFLLDTAILTRISAPLADAVSGRGNAAAMLTAIEAANLFLIPLDRERTWFRYHHLFAESLHSMLQKRAPERVTELDGRAAAWLSQHGQTSEAMTHALAAGDADGAAALVEACAMPLIMQSHLTMVRQWLSLLPPELIARRPRLQLAEVWIQFHMSRPQEAVEDPEGRQALDRRPGRQRRHRPARKPCAARRAVDADRQRRQRRRPFAHRGAAVRAWLEMLSDDQPFLKGTLGNIHAFCHYSLGAMDQARAPA